MLAQYGLDAEGSGRSHLDIMKLQSLQRSIQTRNDELKSIKAELSKSLNKQQEMRQELSSIKTMVMVVGVFVAICMQLLCIHIFHTTQLLKNT